MTKVLDILRSSSDWTKGALGRDACGRALGDSFVESAVCFCLGGAIIKAKASQEPVRMAIQKLFPDRVSPLRSVIVGFNDHPYTTFDDVVTVITEAGV